MEWPDLTNSELFRKLRARELPHPTSGTFNPQTWRDAALAVPRPGRRDRDLAVAALHYGREIASVRAAAEDKLIAGFSRARAIRLFSAMANQQFLTLRDNALKEMKRARRDGPIHFDQLGQQLLEGAQGQEMTADDSIAYLVDSLPHWLHHIWTIPEDAGGTEPVDCQQFAARAIKLASIEHSLRNLWQGALWEENALRIYGATIVEEPTHRQLAKRWFIWDMRQSALLAWEHQIDSGAAIVTGGKLPPVTPAIKKTVIKVDQPKGGRRRFVTGAARGHRSDQRAHVSERDMLERLYTGLFMDEPLPNTGDLRLTCRELNAAWWVLADLARLVVAGLGKPWMPNDRAVGRFAISISTGDMVQVLADCFDMGGARARAIVDLLTCDPRDTGKLFAKSFWSTPLLPEPGSDRRYMILAPLLVGSPVKRIEAWMERGGISDNSGVKGRGQPFEAHVRSELAAALRDNDLMPDHIVHPTALKRKKGSEEIDLLLRVGHSVIIGEVKCFVSPSEPLEKHNYLQALGKAVEQAKAKRGWVDANRPAVARLLGVENPAEAAKLIFQPLIVVNHGFGFGLSRDGVAIVDLHYLRLLLGSGEYQGETRFDRDIGMIWEPVELYGDQADFERRLPMLLENPPPLRRFENAVGWRRQPFPTSSGRPFFIELPTLAELPADKATLQQLERVADAHRAPD